MPAIENLYDKAQSAVLFKGSTGKWFITTVGVKHGCLLSPTLFNIFLERIMCEALDDHEGSVSIGGQFITNFRFADDIVVNAEYEEAGILVGRLNTTTTRYKMEIGPDKTKVMTNNPNGFCCHGNQSFDPICPKNLKLPFPHPNDALYKI